jgi:dTMP kinase
MITERSARPQGVGDRVPAPWRIGAPRGKLFTIEGVWGAGKTTAARLAAARLAQAGFTVTVLHYGPEPGSAGHLSQFLETAPLRSRTGLGGYAAPHHAAVDVLLRLCREAHHQLTFFQSALAAHDAVIIDRGVYSKLAWALAVLAETSPGTDPAVLLGQLHAAAGPWFCHPDQAVFLDTPWPLARERAIARGHGGGNPAAIERLIFLPRYLNAYRQVLDACPGRVTKIRTSLRDPADIADETAGLLAGLLNTSPPAPAAEGS